ncbi:MAG TPA: hypothetical protein VHO03_17100 [Ignavibacteriales bacterium]|nr:hypothetical protein [Ignavibacteriales bacterium]
MKSFIIFIVILLTSCLNAQESNSSTLPKTELEKFSSKRGVLFVKDFYKMDEISGRYGIMEISVVNVYEPGNEKTGKMGMRIEIKEGQKDKTSLLDYDEAESFLKACEYFENTVRKWHSIKKEYSEFKFSTKDDFEFILFNEDDNLSFAATSGDIYRTTCFLDIDKIGQIKAAIQKGLDKIKSLKV